MSGELIDTAAAGGATRASQTLPATLAMSFLAGAYIALAAFLPCAAARCCRGRSGARWENLSLPWSFPWD